MESEGVNESHVPERIAKTRPIKTQSTAVACATASICNAERAGFGGQGGHAGFVRTFSALDGHRAVGWRLVAEASRTKPDPALWSWLDARQTRERPEPTSSEVHFPLLAVFAASLDRPLTWELDETGGEISF